MTETVDEKRWNRWREEVKKMEGVDGVINVVRRERWKERRDEASGKKWKGSLCREEVERAGGDEGGRKGKVKEKQVEKTGLKTVEEKAGNER